MKEIQKDSPEMVTLDLDGKPIETAAKEKKKQIESEVEEKKEEMKAKQLKLLDDFLEKADFKELNRLGFNGEKEMKVKVFREDGSYSVVRAFSFEF